MAAATPPRPASPAPRPVASKPGRNLQISPNLEALLQHDELTRRNSSSPTSAYHSSPLSEFLVSLPPPPPRNANAKGGRKASQREQEQFPTARSKDGHQRRTAIGGCDFWPVALPTSDASAAAQSASGSSSSRPVTPNPYLNPTPVLEPINTTDLDEAPTPKLADRSLPNIPKPDSSRPALEARRPTPSDPSHRPSTALHKVEKILWMGRDSLSLFSGSANGVNRRNDRAELGDLDAVQDRQMRLATQTLSRPSSRFGDNDTATAPLSSKSATSYLHALQQGTYIQLSETALHPVPSREATPVPSRSPAHRLPCLSLPSRFMPHNPPPRSQPADDLTSNDYLSFIDFFSPSTSDELNLYNIQDSSQKIPSRRLESISIPPSSPYSISHHNNLSLTTLTSMRFAPPSPTSLIVQQRSPTDATSATSSSSVTLSAMVFAPPSPSTDLAPTRLQPLSDPPSPYSPLEFAPPPSPLQEVFNGPSLLTAPELASECGRKLKSKQRSKSSSPYHLHGVPSPLPPTTNELGANERADRIRRNRKLARVFGRTPGAEEPITDVHEPRILKKSQPLAGLLTKQKNHRHALSVSLSLKPPGMKTEPSTPWQTGDLWSPDGRRHSTPLATDLTLYMDDKQYKKAKDRHRSRNLRDSLEAASTRSFIDLSDEEVRDDDVSDLSCFAMHQSKYRTLRHSSSTPSLVESLDSEAQAELQRRRKREQLAKLHRCLGSRVPPEAVNGCVVGPPLPLPAPSEEPKRQHQRRGSKSAPSDEFDRGKEELDEREKALIVRRAQKMERVFGTPPPQMLYHTRPTHSTAPVSQPTSPNNFNPYVLTLDLPSSSRNPNQSAYTGKAPHRLGPSDSSRCLLAANDDSNLSSPSSLAQSFADSLPESLSGYQQILAQSSVYFNYQHSLNSLIDIIDRDDRQSLFELYRFFRGDVDESSDTEQVAVNARRASNATSLRSERRHSLPSSASVTSLSSEFHISPKTAQFQIRRRKAAKLTNFFGVDYRELIQDILESIEKGVEEERTKGNLQPQEVEVLMHRVRSLRTMKNPFLS
ncbi:hypothetical protein JVT61DRAFT_5209 [Boletus reticuloceps]|uniref:Uncharacterized protein n=1 Tax=Boletus reticuloceps TaxID=495285 RepID=A0A8I2YWW8_9AGAM|nr:hypothetical protein JVT61DRAFT_5209 [Boletus reticuloceps]